jgi:hypothetical protein
MSSLHCTTTSLGAFAGTDGLKTTISILEFYADTNLRLRLRSIAGRVGSASRHFPSTHTDAL